MAKDTKTLTKEELPDILTAQDISSFLKISRRRIYELFQLNPEYGGIPTIEIGASKRVEREDFINWIESQKTTKKAG